MAKPKVAIFKFASCSGCQQVIINCEDELLTIGALVDFADFKEGSSVELDPPYDVTFVEGSITMPEHIDLIKEIRANSKYLVTLGACANSGGIQALRNFKDVKEFIEIVYASPEYIESLDKSHPVSDYVKVDFELRGCPISKEQFLEVVNALLNGRAPVLPTHSVCIDCKRKGNICVMVAAGKPCLGPVVQTGCGALCPSYHRGCYGCFGPMENPNLDALVEQFRSMGMKPDEIERYCHLFNAWAEPFRKVGELLHV